MSELRAPDPTLSAPALMMNPDGEVFITHEDEPSCAVVWPVGEDGPAIACVTSPTHFLGHHELRHWDIMPLRDAAYVALPCRECFPDAPPPGGYWIDECNCGCGPGGIHGQHEPWCGSEYDPGLSWQVSAVSI